MWKITEGRLAELFPRAAKRLGEDVPLWYAGSLWERDRRVLVIVGARRYSRYGARACREIVYGLAGLPVVIASGLAFGIDSVAHRAALEAGLPTLAVPGSGLLPSVVYPRAHRPLAREIVATGGMLVSPFAPRQGGARWTFPARNRLLAALADAVVVIEGTRHSGTMITARFAAEFGVEVGAVPGKVDDPLREGPHDLIRNGATLVRGAGDCMELIGLQPPASAVSPAHSAPKTGAGEWEDARRPLRERVLALLRARGPMSRDAIAALLSVGAPEVARVISALEVEGLVREEEGEVCVVANPREVG